MLRAWTTSSRWQRGGDAGRHGLSARRATCRPSKRRATGARCAERSLLAGGHPLSSLDPGRAPLHRRRRDRRHGAPHQDDAAFDARGRSGRAHPARDREHRHAGALQGPADNRPQSADAMAAELALRARKFALGDQRRSRVVLERFREPVPASLPRRSPSPHSTMRRARSRRSDRSRKRWIVGVVLVAAAGPESPRSLWQVADVRRRRSRSQRPLSPSLPRPRSSRSVNRRRRRPPQQPATTSSPKRRAETHPPALTTSHSGASGYGAASRAAAGRIVAPARGGTEPSAWPHRRLSGAGTDLVPSATAISWSSAPRATHDVAHHAPSRPLSSVISRDDHEMLGAIARKNLKVIASGRDGSQPN